MTLDALFRSAMASANALTNSIQETVEHYPWIGISEDEGQPAYSPVPTELKCIVERSGELMDEASGDLIKFRYHLVFPYPVTAHGADGRVEPIDERDKFVLPGGVTGPILRVRGPIDLSTRRPYMSEVWLG